MQFILTSFNCCYSNRLRYVCQCLPNASISSHILACQGSRCLSGIHHQMFGIDSVWVITAVSPAKLKGPYCFFGCHSNDVFQLFWLLIKDNILENFKWLFSCFSELWRKRSSTWFQYCSCEFIWASFFHSKSDCHGIFHAEKFATLEWNTFRTRRGIYKQSMVPIHVIFFGSFISDQLGFLGELSL